VAWLAFSTAIPIHSPAFVAWLCQGAFFATFFRLTVFCFKLSFAWSAPTLGIAVHLSAFFAHGFFCDRSCVSSISALDAGATREPIHRPTFHAWLCQIHHGSPLLSADFVQLALFDYLLLVLETEFK
jgi:hypothetical protein